MTRLDIIIAASIAMLAIVMAPSYSPHPKAAVAPCRGCCCTGDRGSSFDAIVPGR